MIIRQITKAIGEKQVWKQEAQASLRWRPGKKNPMGRGKEKSRAWTEGESRGVAV